MKNKSKLAQNHDLDQLLFLYQLFENEFGKYIDHALRPGHLKLNASALRGPTDLILVN